MLNYASALLDGFWTYEVNGGAIDSVSEKRVRAKTGGPTANGYRTLVLVEPGEHAQQSVLLWAGVLKEAALLKRCSWHRIGE